MEFICNHNLSQNERKGECSMEAMDVINRRALSQLSDKEISKEMKNTISSLNRKMKRLEKSGLAEYNYSYKRLTDYTEASLKKHYFSSKSVTNAGRQQRIEFLVALKHYNTYMLNAKDTKKMLQQEASRLSNAINQNLKEGEKPINLSVSDLLAVKDALEIYKYEVGHTNLFKEWGSPELQTFFAENVGMSYSQIMSFINGLKELDTKEGRLNIKPYIDNYDRTLGIAIKRDGVIEYNPITNKLYDSLYGETNYTYNANGQILDKDGNIVDYDTFLKNSR